MGFWCLIAPLFESLASLLLNITSLFAGTQIAEGDRDAGYRASRKPSSNRGSAMIPTTVTFYGRAPSQWIETDIRKRAAKLETCSTRIACSAPG